MFRPKADSTVEEDWTILMPAGADTESRTTDFPYRTDPVPFQRDSLFPRSPEQSENPPAFDMIIETPGDSPAEEKATPIRPFLTKFNTLILRSDGVDLDIHTFYTACLDTLCFAMRDPRAAGTDLSDFSIFAITHSEPAELFSYLQKEFHWSRPANAEGIYRFLAGPFRMQILVTTQLDPDLLPSSRNSKGRMPGAGHSPLPSSSRAKQVNDTLTILEFVCRENLSFFLADKSRMDSLASLCATLAAALVSVSVTPEQAVDDVLRRIAVPLDKAEVLALVKENL